MIFTVTFDVQSGGLGYDDDKRDCCHSIVFIVTPFDNSAGGAQNLCRSRHICSTKWRNSIWDSRLNEKMQLVSEVTFLFCSKECDCSPHLNITNFLTFLWNIFWRQEVTNSPECRKCMSLPPLPFLARPPASPGPNHFCYDRAELCNDLFMGLSSHCEWELSCWRPSQDCSHDRLSAHLLPPICSQAVGMSPARPIGLRPSLGTKIEPGGGQFITPCWNELQLKPLTKPLSWNALEGAAQIFGLRPPLGGTSPYIISLTIVFKANCQP